MHGYFTISPTVKKFVAPQQILLSGEQKSNTLDINNLTGTENHGYRYYLPPTTDERIFYNFFKRGMDIVVSLMLLLISLPLTALIALIIKMTSPGTVLFKHRWIGIKGQEFECWKFRTMISNADEVLRQNPHLLKQFNKKFKIDNDVRVTKFGKFLRRSSLDEIPQLVQILQGKMSLIGPRPVIDRELEKYSIYRDKLLSIKPGLSGLWQISGRSETTYAERVLLDMQYIETRGILLDTKILFKTIITVLKRSGAC